MKYIYYIDTFFISDDYYSDNVYRFNPGTTHNKWQFYYRGHTYLKGTQGARTYINIANRGWVNVGDVEPDNLFKELTEQEAFIRCL